MSLVLFFTVVLALVSCNSENTEFDQFLISFSNDIEFQKEHISFPLPCMYSEFEDTISSVNFIQKDEWEHEDFVKNPISENSTTDQYTFIQKQKKDTVLYQKQGIDNGIFVTYFFVRIGDDFQLKKIVDDSN